MKFEISEELIESTKQIMSQWPDRKHTHQLYGMPFTDVTSVRITYSRDSWIVDQVLVMENNGSYVDVPHTKNALIMKMTIDEMSQSFFPDEPTNIVHIVPMPDNSASFFIKRIPQMIATVELT